MTNRRISFVLPARNEPPSIVAATIEGLLSTTRGGWREIIVIDDGSAEPVQASGPGVSVIRNSRPMGVSRARQLGTDVSTGDILVWLDAHMTFGAGWLEAMLAEVDSEALLCTPWRSYTHDHVHCWGSDFGWCEDRAYEHGMSPGFQFAPRRTAPRRACTAVPMLIGACYMSSREAFERLGGFCPLFRTYGGDEADLSARAWLFGRGARCVARAEVGHLDRPRFPYAVAFDDVEFNQVVTIRSLFEDRTAKVLEEFLLPLPETVAQRLVYADVAGWRADLQKRRRMSDAEFFRRIAPHVPISFGKTVQPRRGHVPPWRLRASIAAEKSMVLGVARGDCTQSLRQSPPVAPSTYIVISAGAVIWQGRAIILPGEQPCVNALLTELVLAGAMRYSHAFVTLDFQGRLRAEPAVATETNIPAFVPVGLIASIKLSPRSTWRLQRVTPAQAALHLIANTVGKGGAELFCAVNRAVTDAIAMEGQRGPAAPVARALLRYLSRSSALQSGSKTLTSLPPANPTAEDECAGLRCDGERNATEL